MTRRGGVGFAFASAFISVPAVALACTACGDHVVRIRWPWMMAATASLGLWALGSAVLGLVLDGKIQGKPAPVPGRKLTAALTVLAVVGGISGAVAVGSNFMALFGVAVVLGLVVLALTVRSLLVRPLPRASIGIAVVHALFVGLACWNGWSSQRQAGAAENLVSLLGYEIPLVSEVVVPRVVALGDSAVSALEERAGAALSSEDERRSAYYFFSLEAIGTPKACTVLEDLYRKVPGSPAKSMRFLRSAWACCGERAVQQLMGSYQGPSEIDVLFALLRSSQPKAVLFTLNHLDSLQSATARGDKLAQESLRLLETGKGAQDIRALHVYARRAIGSPSEPVGYRNQLYDGAEDVPPKGIPAAELRAKWEAILGAASP